MTFGDQRGRSSHACPSLAPRAHTSERCRGPRVRFQSARSFPLGLVFVACMLLAVFPSADRGVGPICLDSLCSNKSSTSSMIYWRREVMLLVGTLETRRRRCPVYAWNDVSLVLFLNAGSRVNARLHAILPSARRRADETSLLSNAAIKFDKRRL